MIPIVDEQEKYDSLVENFYLLIGRRMKVHHLFFLASCPFLDALSIESQASLFRYHSFHSQIWYLCNKP